MDDTEEHWDEAQEGAERLREGDAKGAISELEEVVLRSPKNEYGYFFLGSAHFEQGHFDKAMKAYLLALELAPGYTGAMVHLGHTLRMLGRYRQALKMGHQVLSRNKDDADALYLMGLTHYSMGDRAAASGYLERFLECDPEIEPAQEARGLLEILNGQIVEGQIQPAPEEPAGS